MATGSALGLIEAADSAAGLGWPSRFGRSGQWPRPCSGEGLGQADAVAAGLAVVGVVQEPVDGRRVLGHELVERGRVQVGADRDGTFLVGGVDEAVEPFGGVRSDGEQADVVALCGHPHRSTYADTATMPEHVRAAPKRVAAEDLARRLPSQLVL